MIRNLRPGEREAANPLSDFPQWVVAQANTIRAELAAGALRHRQRGKRNPGIKTDAQPAPSPRLKMVNAADFGDTCGSGCAQRSELR